MKLDKSMQEKINYVLKTQSLQALELVWGNFEGPGPRLRNSDILNSSMLGNIFLKFHYSDDPHVDSKILEAKGFFPVILYFLCNLGAV